MRVRSFLAAASAILLFATVFDSSTSRAQERPAKTASPARPNVVLVFVDDMGWGDFSCFGNEDATTDRIDELAAEGIRFEQFYVNSPICSPSRCAILTGQYPQRHRIGSYLAGRRQNASRGIADWLDPSAPTLSRILHDASYATGHFGKWHLGGQRDVGDAPAIADYGFDASLTNFEGLGPRVLPLCDAFDGKPPRRHALGSDTLGSDTLGRGPILWENRAQITSSFVGEAIRFIDRAQADGKPFFVNVWPDDVHSPFYPPAALRGDGSKRKLYLGVLEAMDEQLGALFDRIRGDKKLRDETLILICSDNGPEMGAGRAGPFRGYKTMLYEGGVRSPLIAWGPGVLAENARGVVDDESFFCAFDLAPTILALANVGVPEGVAFDGEPLPETLTGEAPRSRSGPVYFRRPPDRDAFYGVDDLPDLAMRKDGWKLLCEYDGSSPELYDLNADPGETKNVGEFRPDVVAEMSAAILKWHRSMPSDRGVEYRLPPRRKK